MENADNLREKVLSAVELIRSLKQKNQKMIEQNSKLMQENELLLSENMQVRRVLSELDQMKNDRKMIQQKCERLMARFDKLKV